MMDGEVIVCVTVKGLVTPPGTAANIIVNEVKRALFKIDGGEDFGAEIINCVPPLAKWDVSVLDENREWQRVRDSNSRGVATNGISGAAP
jgi:hypothetical protein